MGIHLPHSRCGATVMKHERSERRSDALKKTRIVDAAIALLNAGGAEALTFRALAAKLSTGAGALYHHVANKNELLSAAAAVTMTDVLTGTGGANPAQGIRTLTLGV